MQATAYGVRYASASSSIMLADKIPAPMDNRPATPLQAANILAYETTKEVVRRLTPVNPRAVRGSIKNLGRVEID